MHSHSLHRRCSQWHSRCRSHSQCLHLRRRWHSQCQHCSQASRSIRAHSHRWLGSLWKQTNRIKAAGDEDDKNITAMSGADKGPVKTMYCSSILPDIPAGEEVVQRSCPSGKEGQEILPGGVQGLHWRKETPAVPVRQMRRTQGHHRV